jgi:hypothetical protein
MAEIFSRSSGDPPLEVTASYGGKCVAPASEVAGAPFIHYPAPNIEHRAPSTHALVAASLGRWLPRRRVAVTVASSMEHVFSCRK